MNEVYIEAYEEEYAPPSLPQLRMSKVGTQFFIEIVEREESTDEVTFKVLASVSVKAEDFYNALVGAGFVSGVRYKS